MLIYYFDYLEKKLRRSDRGKEDNNNKNNKINYLFFIVGGGLNCQKIIIIQIIKNKNLRNKSRTQVS